VDPTFGRPATIAAAADDPNRIVIDVNTDVNADMNVNANVNANVNPPSGAAHHAQQSPPPPRVLCSSLQQQQSSHTPRAVGIAPRPPQHELQSQQQQQSPQQPSQSPGSPSTVPLDNAQFGHSLYFIEHLFPSKLWRILDDAERCGYDNVISWVDTGLAFQIREYLYVVLICNSGLSCHVWNESHRILSVQARIII
jgi:hypothetical protein